MELRVLLLTSLTILLIAGCTVKGSFQNSYNIDSLDIKSENGIVKNDEILFTGRLYELNNAGTDTIFIKEYKNGIEDGMHKIWYPNQKICEIRYYTAGKKTGQHIGYWPNGTIKFKYTFNNDLFEGTQYEWYMDGQPFSKKEYKDGHESGLQQTWLMDGKVRSNYEAKNGRNYGNIGKKNCFSKI